MISGCLAALALSGCALEHTSMSMDSISRVPFFGFQLAPKRKDPAVNRTISRNSRLADDAVEIRTAQRDSEPDRTWPSWLSLPGSKPVIPLPRTDVPASQTAHASAEADEPVRIEF